MSSWQRAFVLHSHPYSETSLLIDFFVETKGRITILAKGARRKRSPQRGILQPFTPLIIQYSGAGRIKILRYAEAISLTLPLSHVFLYSAFYVNELVHRVITAETETTSLFLEYLDCLQALAAAQKTPEYALRCFEVALLKNLGYKMDFDYCCITGNAITASKNYEYKHECGFSEVDKQNDNSFTGYQLQAFAKRVFSDEETLLAAKRFSRLALRPYIGSQPFKSRELFRT